MLSRRIGLLLAVAAAIVVTAPARAGVPWGPGYDGTGSMAHGKARDEKAAADYAAESHREMDDLRAQQTKAADGGSARAMVKLGSLLEQGYTSAGVDLQGAFDLYEKAADKGNTTALEKVCVAYLLGEGRPVNVSKGMAYCNTLGDKDPAALFAGAFDFDKGVSGPRDEAHAITLYLKAGQAGNGEGMDGVGRAALAMKRPDLARKWFRQGVFLGAADAMDHLAAMAEAGEGGPADKAEAYWLYVNAARRGNAHARAWVDALPAGTEPLPRSSVLSKVKGVEKGTITMYGEHNEVYTLSRVIDLFTGFYPAGAGNDSVAGDVLVHCYVNADHVVDVCIVEYEYPIGYYFGNFAQAFFNQRLTVPAADTVGDPTANTVFTLGFAWKLN